MEKQPLEKIIEKLEKIDIREWERDGNSFNARTRGLLIHLHVYKDMGMTCCHIELISEDKHNELRYDPKNKAEKNMIKSFYEKTCKKYQEYKDTEFEDRVNAFLSD